MGNRVSELAEKETFPVGSYGEFSLKRVLLYGWDGTAAVRIGVDSDGQLLEGAFGTIATFVKNVTTAGTREQVIVASTPCKVVLVSARTGNTNLCVVGDINVVAAEATQRGTVIIPGSAPVLIKINNLNKLYVDSLSNGDGICGSYLL